MRGEEEGCPRVSMRFLPVSVGCWAKDEHAVSAPVVFEFDQRHLSMPMSHDLGKGPVKMQALSTTFRVITPLYMASPWHCVCTRHP